MMLRRKNIITFLTVLVSLPFLLPPVPAQATASLQAAEWLCERGVSFLNQDQADRALVEFQKALLANPNSVEARQYIEMIKRPSAQKAGAQAMPEREQELYFWEGGRAPAAPRRLGEGDQRDRARRPQSRMIWRLEKKMLEITDAVIVEKKQAEEPVAAAEIPGSQVPLGVAAALGVPAAVSQEIVVDLRELDKTEPMQEVKTAVGDSVIIRSDRITRFLAADPAFLEATRLKDGSIRVVPKEIGSVIFYVWEGDQRTSLKFDIGPIRWEEAWAQQIEERDRLATLPESFKLSYSIQGDSYYTGRRIETSKRQSHTYQYTSSAIGDTPVGRFDAAIRGTRSNAKLVYVPNIRMGLSDAHYADLKDIDIRWFDFSSSFSAFGFPGTTLRGVRLDAPMFDHSLRYTTFWGALPAGYYSQLEPQSGLSKTKKAWLEGIGLSYRLGKLVNARGFFVHSYGPERSQPVLTSDTWGAGLDGRAGLMNWATDVSSDTEHLSYTARTAFRLRKLNIGLSMTERKEDYASVFGGGTTGGSIGGTMSVVYRPADPVTLSEVFSGNRDRFFGNPDKPERPNYNSDTRFTWAVDPFTDVELGYTMEDRLGSNVPSVTESKEATFRRRLFFFRQLNTFLSYQNTKNKSYDSPAQDFNNNRILAGVSFRLISELYFYYRKELNLLRNTFSGERARPLAQEMGLSFYRQLWDTPFTTSLRLSYRDEEDTESTLSYLSGEDRLEGEGQLSYKFNPDSEAFFRMGVANVWVEKQGVTKHMDWDISWGMRFVWDTGFRWYARGGFCGLVYKDVNADGVKQKTEPGVAGVLVRIGDREARTNDSGYYHIPDIVGPRAFVEIDPGSLPLGYSPTTEAKRDVEVVYLATRRVDFGVATRTEITGLVFVDKNASGAYDSGDEPLEGVVLVLDGKGKSASGRLGEYMFRGLSPGDHTVALDLSSVAIALIPKVPVKKVVTVTEGAALTYNIPMEPQAK